MDAGIGQGVSAFDMHRDVTGEWEQVCVSDTAFTYPTAGMLNGASVGPFLRIVLQSFVPFQPSDIVHAPASIVRSAVLSARFRREDQKDARHCHETRVDAHRLLLVFFWDRILRKGDGCCDARIARRWERVGFLSDS